ncbi:MAG: T9SS type A sorting domain-containing protein [Prevotellaceae bacterium]|jgi:hypothetical protein|nr:T9SS type A sorting domain-containing protein [Prevotellaceae bacterium]
MKTQSFKSRFVKLIFLCLCFWGICNNAFADVEGLYFTPEGLLKDLIWNQEKGRVEFKIIFFDNWGNLKSEFFKSADLYINGTSMLRIEAVCGANGQPTNAESSYANLYIKNLSSTGSFSTYGSSSTNCSELGSNLKEHVVPANGSGYYSYNIDNTSPSSRLCFAQIYWYQGDLTANKTITIRVSGTVMEQNSGQTKSVNSGDKTLDITLPSVQGHSITGGNIGSGGQLSFTCNANEASSIQLLKGSSVTETQTGSNVTFTGKYLATESEFLNGATFGFISRKAVSDGRTTYIQKSNETITSQRTGVFYNNLTTSIETCGNVNLNWHIKNPSSTNNINTQGFVLQVKIDDGGWKDLDGIIDYTANAGGITGYSYTYKLPDNDLNTGEHYYQFRIRRAFVEFEDAVLKAIFQRNVSLNINTDFKQLTGIEITPNGNDGYPRLSWKMTTSGIECNDNISLKLKLDGSSETNIPKGDILNGSYQTSSSNGINNCTPQRYELVLQYGTHTAVTYLVNDKYVYESTGKREFEKIVVSKGYYTDRNNIKWYLRNGYDEFTQFRVLRKEAGQPDDEYISIENIAHIKNVLQYNFDDREINAGVYYIYKIEGVYQCADKYGSISSPVSVGFSQPYGSVSGRVTYTGSQAVSNVEIKAATDNALNSNRELEFNSVRAGSLVSIPAGTRLFNREGFSFEAWLKFLNSTGEQTLFSNSLLTVKRGTDNKITVKMANSSAVTVPNIITVGEYAHLSVTVEKQSDYKNYKITVYLNGLKSYTETVSLSSDAVTPVGATKLGEAYNGYIDDVRLWDKVLTAEEIALNYDRVLGGKETGLAAYYKFDEIDVAESSLFDCSAVGTAFNGNHAEKGSGVNRSSIPVSASHLTIKGVTDENGNYSIINSIPYTSEGTTYTLSPTLGIHQFDPNNRPLYFSPDSKVFNNIDFTDISSFPVSGQVTYAGTNYPVEGVQIAVDGTIANKDGKAIETGADGTFTIDVPIGSHFISLSKQGHTFVDGGRFPVNPSEQYNFQTSMSGLTFYDNTTVNLKGRVAGGNFQSAKPTGMGLSKANIGKATITLKAVSDVYKLNLTDSDLVYENLIGGKTSKTTFKKTVTGSTIEIETNPETGEFLAVLPPVPYEITNVKTKEYEDNFGGNSPFSYNKTTFNMNPFAADTLSYIDTATKKIVTLVSHDSLKIIRYNTPTIEVRDTKASAGAFGDNIYLYTDPLTGNKDTIPLYSIAGGTVNYKLGVPVLTQSTLKYYWEIKAYEEYSNSDDSDTVIVDRVPLAGSMINVRNALAAERIELDSVTLDVLERKDSQTSIILDSTGSRIYAFAVSFPNLANDHKLNARMELSSNGQIYSWSKDAILLGQMPTDGNNFVTQGPDFVDVILHDPPGSNSYAYIEQGSSYTSTVSTSSVSTVTSSTNTTLHIGPKITTSSGFGFEVELEIQPIVDVEIQKGTTTVTTDNNEKETTVTFNQQVATSSDPNYVGSMADMYIGRSTNIVYGMMNQLALYPVAETPEGVTPSGNVDGFNLFAKQVLTSDLEFGTNFHYTQAHIIESQIPNIKALRNQLIDIADSKTFDSTAINFGVSNVKYITFLEASDPDFGAPKTYYVYYKPGSEEERVKRDQVWEYNNWIKNWEERIAYSEEFKVTLFKKRAEYEANAAGSTYEAFNNKRLFENISYDAGVALEKSQEVSYSNVSVKGSSFATMGGVNTALGLTVNEAGLVVSIEASDETETGKETATGSGNSIKFGYVFAEDESVLFAGKDALSVDVYGPSSTDMIAGFSLNGIHNLTGFTFQRRAGQTSCPYEGPDSTIYYKVNDQPALLNYGTFKIENGIILIDNNTSASVNNIPAGREGTFTLQLSNVSDAKLDVTFRLSVDAATNPNGLILELDGQPLTDVRQFRLTYGETLYKTLKVRQSSQDILEYKDIALRFGSVCDAEDYVEAYINATFIPSSSPVKLVSNSRLANVEGINNGGKIRFTISDFDTKYHNFGCIRLQYRNAVNENWTTLREYINNEALYPVDSDSKEKIAGATCMYDFAYDATTPSDGEYVFRAVSVSKIGTQEITFESEEIRIVKDTKAPQVLGYPSPVNGILNAGDEISVTFNEDIQSNKLVGGTVGSNFKITGILNGDIREEPTSGISFSGSQSAYTDVPIYSSGSFSVETWFKRTNNTAGTLFAYGSGNNYISLGFDATGRAVVSIGNESHTSTLAIDNTDDTWKYIGLSYNRETGMVSVNEYQGVQTLKLFENKIYTNAPAVEGKLYVGNTAAGNSGFDGAVALLHFYNIARSEAQMSSTKSLTKSGTETNLVGLWELEADEGALGKDKARSRHLNLNNTSRYIYPLGKSLAFNGDNQYARVTSGAYSFGIYADFTLEFWFKGGSQELATLLSVGVTTYVGFDAEHRLVLTTEGSSQILASAGLLDDKWHHFALSVKRNGNARAIIDGAVTASFNSGIFGDIGGGYYHLGVKYIQVNDYTYNYTEHFKGNIDELRVWNSALTTDAIVLNKNYSLLGDEAGLKAYYPFEKTQQVNGNVYSVDPSLKDVIDNTLTAELFGNASVSEVSTPLQLARPVKNVPFTFTASNNKIALNITEEEYRIDGVTLYITTENVLDMHDNVSSTVNWIAYVNRNALNWNIDLVDIIMEEGENHTFKASISNSGGEKQDYFIEDLPSWLSVNAPQGSLNPLSSKELTFTVAPGINIGAYEANVVLTGVNNVRKILPVSLKVTGDRPDWSVNPSDYEQSMTIVGQLLIKNLPQEDPDDLLAAFVGNTCVGLVSPKYEAAYQSYLIYLQVWGNASDNGKELTFKIWDASTGNIYPTVELSHNSSPIQLQFAGNALKGTPGKPVKFNALEDVEQSMLLDAGWNWVSFNVASPLLANANELMRNITNGVEIKGQISFSRYETESDYWTNGTLSGAGFSNTQMYMVKMDGANTIALPGSPLDVENTPIDLYSGWNWISYIPQVNETVAEAFAGANPEDGDVVKSQVAFSVYDAIIGSWVGTLEYMRPGQGYMYNTTLARSFKYPKTGAMTRSSEGDPTEGEPLTLNRPYPSLNSEIAPNYESSLSLIGEVRLKSDYLSESARLIAIVGGEPRGIAEIRKVGDKRLFFLPVYSNIGNETVTFVLENNGREIPLREQIRYKANALVGTVSSPTLLTDANINLKVYPNPFIDRMTASFEIEEAGTNVRIELVSMSGAVIYSTTHAIISAGPQLVSIDGSATDGLAEGTYIIRVTLSNGETFTNIVIKNQY